MNYPPCPFIALCSLFLSVSLLLVCYDRKSLPIPSSLSLTRLHTGETPYQCTFCQKKFTRKEHLTNHTRWAAPAYKTQSKTPQMRAFRTINIFQIPLPKPKLYLFPVSVVTVKNCTKNRLVSLARYYPWGCVYSFFGRGCSLEGPKTHLIFSSIKFDLVYWIGWGGAFLTRM